MGEWMDVTYAEKCHMLFSEYVPCGKNKIKIKAMFISKIVVFPQSTTPSLLEYSKL